jgi:hypothetical protein
MDKKDCLRQSFLSSEQQIACDTGVLHTTHCLYGLLVRNKNGLNPPVLFSPLGGKVARNWG